MTSYLFYLLIIFVSVLLYCIAGKIEKYKIMYSFFIILGCTIPAIVYAIRIDTGSDWWNYYVIYEEVTNPFDYYLEKGFTILIYICKYFNLNFYVFNFVVASIIQVCSFFAMKNLNIVKHAWIGQFVYFFSLYLVGMNGVRQIMAASILLLGVSFLVKNKLKWYVILQLIAVLFHSSAFIGIIFVLLLKIRRYIKFKFGKSTSKNIKTFFLVIVGSFLGVAISTSAVTIIHELGFFQAYDISFDIEGLGFLLYFIPEFAFLLFFRPNEKNRNTSLSFLFDCFCLLCPFQALGIMAAYADRLSLYFSAVRVVIYPLIYEKLSKKNKITFVVVFIIWFLIYFYIMYVILEANRIIPYKCIFKPKGI